MKLKASYVFRHGCRGSHGSTDTAATGAALSCTLLEGMATTLSRPDTSRMFTLWGYVNDLVYQVRINDLAHLKTRITQAINSVPPDMLGRVWEELEYRLDVCRATNGPHIELH